PGARLPVVRYRGHCPASQNLCRVALPGDAPGPPGLQKRTLRRRLARDGGHGCGAARRHWRPPQGAGRYGADAPVHCHGAAAPVSVRIPAEPVPSAEPLLPDTLPSPEAERRRLTVLFCDLVGSTALAGHLDPEDLREVVRAYHQTCAEVIQRFDGYIAQYLGDGVLVYFGYPVAHEDDAQRAVWTGLGMLDTMGPLNTRLALPPAEQV